MQLYTIDQMRDLEKQADAAGHAYHTMMELAGRAVAQEVMKRVPSTPAYSPKVLVVAGSGNNGGDGLVAGLHLAQNGYRVAALVWQREENDAIARQARQAGVSVTRAIHRLPELLSRMDVVIDALFGIGLSRAIEEDPATILRDVGEARYSRDFLLVGVDGPSGLNGDTGDLDPATVAADVSVTFAGPKVGMVAAAAVDAVGELVVADIGIPSDVATEAAAVGEWLTADSVRAWLPNRPRSGHKGTFGTVLVIGGSQNYVGAPALAAVAAGRGGAGLVSLAVPHSIHPILAARPDLTTTTWHPLPHEFGAVRAEAAATLRAQLDKVKAVVLGPGLGSESTTRDFVYAFLGVTKDVAHRRAVGFIPTSQSAKRDHTAHPLPPAIIDADGLNALAAYEGDWWRSVSTPLVLTPHAAELGRLRHVDTDTIQQDRISSAKEAADTFGQVVVLKGAYTVIAAPDGRLAVSPFATSALAKAGAGDVLSGIVGGLLAQGTPPYEAACLAVYLHGIAGEQVQAQVGERGAVASDLLDAIPTAWQVLTEL